MKRAAASLMPLVTCPSFAIWHLIGAVICIPALLYVGTSADVEIGGYVATFLLPVWSAIVLTSLQKDLLHKPFSFTLPGHRSLLRRTSFLVGIVVSIVAALPVLTFPGLDGPSLLLAVWSAFCFGLTIYLVIVGMQMFLDAAGTSLALCMVACGVLIEFTGARVLVQETALFAPSWNTGVLAVVAVILWRLLGSAELARRTCGGRFLSLQMAWRRSAGERFWLSKRRKSWSKGRGSLRRWLLEMLFARISRRPSLSIQRHLAAAQYELVGYLVPVRPWTIPINALCILVVLAVGGYAPLSANDAPVTNALYVVSCVVGMQLAIPMFNTMLFPVGRREKFLSSIAFAICGGLVVLATSLLIFVVLAGLGRLAPSFSLGGKAFQFRPADLAPALVPLVHLPLSMILKITCKKWLLIPEILLIMSAAVVIFKASAALADLPLYVIFTCLSVSWAMLVAVLYHYSLHRDLVRK